MISDEYVSAVDLAADIKDMKVSPSEVIEETIKAIDERNPSINAFVYTNYEGFHSRHSGLAGNDRRCQGTFPYDR